MLWISEWPRIDVAPHFLHALIFAPDIRKSLSLLARPLGTVEALRALRKEKTEAITDAGHKAKVGQVQDLSDVQEYNDLLKREQALIGGHADVEFSGFITVTASQRRRTDTGGGADRALRRSVGVRDPGPLRAPVAGIRRRGVAPRAQCLLTEKG